MIRKNTINYENILKVLSSNKNNNIDEDINLEIKNNDVITIELNKQSIELLNLGFVYYKNNYDLVYDKNMVLLVLKNFNISGKVHQLVVYSVLEQDGIRTFIIFSKYASIDFHKFLHNILTLENGGKRIEYNIKGNNNKNLYGKSKKLRNNNKLRHQFNKQYDYLSKKEMSLLDKHSNKVIDKIENNRFWNMEYTFLEWLDLKYEELESLDYCSKEYDEVLYDIKELEHHLKKDIQENMFYSSINY